MGHKVHPNAFRLGFFRPWEANWFANPKTPWGKPALGYRTRKPSKASSKLIIRHREKKGRKK